MESKKSRRFKYSDVDSSSKSKPNRSKNKPKSKKQQQIFDKDSAASFSISQTQTTFNNSSSLKDKKKSSQNNKSSSQSTTRHTPPRESISKQTSILLGFPNGDILASEDTDPYTTKLGGKPNWLRKSHPLSHDVILCKNCDEDMFLLFQGYVPLEDSIYDRVIYVFGCNQQKCMNKNGSFRSFRAHRKDEEYERKYQEARKNKYRSNQNNNNFSTNIISEGLGNMLFGVIDSDNMDEMQISEKEEDIPREEKVVVNDENGENEDDYYSELIISNKMSSSTRSWSQVVSDTEKTQNKTNQAEDQVSKYDNDDDDTSQIVVDMSMMTLRTNWPENVRSFPAQYLYISEEVLEEKSNDDISAKYWSYEEDLLNSSRENEDNFDWLGEKYEKPMLPKGYDKTFKKFSDRVAEWPDQCVRYQFDGQPLLYTSDETSRLLLDNFGDKITSSKLPVCHYCGSERVFELQLMPNVLSTLSTSSYVNEDKVSSSKKNDNSIFNLGMEWGTIMIFTCRNDCEKIGVGFDEVSYYEEVVIVQYEK